MGTPKTGASCQEYLIAEWGYESGPPLSIIPNAGVCARALAVYGAGSLRAPSR